jgi:hypothetical protein
MRHSIAVIGVIGLVACRGGERPPQGETEQPAGSLAIAIPDSSPGAAEAAAAVSMHAVPTAEPGDTVVVGVVQEVGAMPLTQLVVQRAGGGEPRSVGIRGPLRRDIQNLVGAEVRVWGRPAANQPPTPPRAVEVTGYEILSVGGATPVVGTLAADGGGFYLVTSGDRLALDPMPENLRALIGAKIWAVGRRDGGTLHVESYGVIRRPE